MRIFPLLAAAFVLAASPVTLAESAGNQLYAEGQRAFYSGDYDTAEAKFTTVLEMNPKHVGAQNFLRMIRAKQAESGNSKLRRDLQALILPSVNFKDATFRSALDYLEQRAEEAQAGISINFVPQVPSETLSRKVSLNVSNIPFTEALRYLGEMTNVTFDIETYAVVVKSKPAEEESPTTVQ